MDKNGYALVTALIFLVVLSLVAVTALRSSGLELHMSSNNALRTESFESSESPRLIIGDVLDANVFNHGLWPNTVTAKDGTKGTVPPAEFDLGFPTGLKLMTTASWTNNTDEASNCPTSPFVCTNGALQTDATYSRLVPSASAVASLQVTSNLSIYQVRTDGAPGAGQAQMGGYLGLGRGTASAGGRKFFYVSSRGIDANPGTTAEAQTETAAMYRDIIRH